jgi:hypothetical protein
LRIQRRSLAATPPRWCMARERVIVIDRDQGPGMLSPKPQTTTPRARLGPDPKQNIFQGVGDRNIGNIYGLVPT